MPKILKNPNTSRKGPNTKTFVAKMEKQWKKIAKGDLPKAEIQAYESIVKTVTAQPIQEIDDLPVPSTWAEITALKILFPNDFFSSRHAVVAQEKFPTANIGAWKLNKKGPTTAQGWKQNPFRSPPPNRSGRVLRSQTARDSAELTKRARSSEATDDAEEREQPFKKRRLASANPVEDNSKDIVDLTIDYIVEDSANDVENTVANPGPSKHATSPLPDETADSDDSNEYWSEFDDKLDLIRKAAKEGTKITTRMMDCLQKAHLEELKRQQPDRIFKQIEKQHAQELRNIRVRYEGVITTWLRGVASGVRALLSTRQELSMLSDHKE